MEQSQQKLSLARRWSDARPTKTVVFWSCVATKVVTMVVGFTWGGWVTGGTAVGLRSIGPEEFRGSAIQGGKTRQLVVGDVALRTSLDLSYRTLHPVQQRAMCLLALLDVPDFAPWLAAATLDCPVAEAEDVLEGLVDARLLSIAPTGEPGGSTTLAL